MNKFFITKGTEKKGPYSIDDLKKMELTDDYLIWKDGFEKWTSISEIIELKNEIIITPPPTPAQLKRKYHRILFFNSLNTSVMWLLVLLFVIYVVMGGYKNNRELKEIYGYGEHPVFGEGSDIRWALIMSSFLISFVISLVILFFLYRNKTNAKQM